MTNIKDKLTNWLAVILVIGGAVNAYLQVNAGQPIDWMQLIMIAVGAVVSYFTGKAANGTAKKI
jgi:hypothetical protein